MVWCPWSDADAITEAGLISVQLDGADRRCPVVVFELFGIARVPLPPGELEGVLSIEKATASYCMIGSEAQVRWRGCHEGGHLMLCLSGHRLPHDEALASRCGRALAMSRRFVLRLLDEGWRDYEIVQEYAWWLPEEQTERRIWEVRRSAMRRVGLPGDLWVSLPRAPARTGR